MADWVVPLSDVRFSEDEVAAVADTYRSGWLTQGPRVAAFERAFAAFVGSSHAVAVSSGTAALQLICAAARLGAGDEVILPSLTFAATAAAVVHAGASPVFADVRGEERPWLSVDAVRPLVGSRTRAIVTVDYAGHPGEALALRELADERGLMLVEDAAHALGAADGARSAGTIAHAGAFSFFSNKNMPLGEGGMAVTDDPELAARMRLLRSHGLTTDTWARHRGDAAQYEVLEPGFNFRLDEPRAALGLRLLERLAADNAQRAQLAGGYERALSVAAGVRPAITADAALRNAWHIYPVLLDEAGDRDAFRERLRRAGVQTSVHYPPLHLTRAYGGRRSGPLERTEDYARRTVTLPLFPHMSADQQARVVEAAVAAARPRGQRIH